jgi:hypothetical protein
MGATAITATQVQIGFLRDGQKVWTFTAEDTLASASTGAVITLPKTKTIFGNPVISVAVATATSTTAMRMKVVSVATNVITITSSVGADSGAATYYGFVMGK